jgi:transcriptional regulator with XRE-family HTH domain
MVSYLDMKDIELEHIRKRMNLTREELARELKTTYTTVYRWETGSREIPPYLELALHALEFGLAPAEFIAKTVQAVVKAAKKQKVKITDEQVKEIENDAFNTVWVNKK